MRKRFFIFKAGSIQVIDLPINLFAIKEQPKEGFESIKKAEQHLVLHHEEHHKNSKDCYTILPIYYENIR
jgi:hypothetical protein